jgi:hypothetical protein
MSVGQPASQQASVSLLANHAARYICPCMYNFFIYLFMYLFIYLFSPGSVNANVTVLFNEPTTAPLEEIEQAVSNGTFGDLNVSSVVPLPSGKF